MYSIVAIINNPVFYICNLLSVDLKYSHLTHKKGNCEKMNGFIKLIMVIISQCIHVLAHHILHLKYIQFLAITLQ